MSNHVVTIDPEDVTLTDLSRYFGIDKDVYVCANPTMCRVNYSIEIHRRPWGIDCIEIVITRVLVAFEWYVDPRELIDTDIDKLLKYGEFTHGGDRISGRVDLDTINTDWDLDNNIQINSGMIHPGCVEVDFLDRRVMVG